MRLQQQKWDRQQNDPIVNHAIDLHDSNHTNDNINNHIDRNAGYNTQEDNDDTVDKMLNFDNKSTVDPSDISIIQAIPSTSEPIHTDKALNELYDIDSLSSTNQAQFNNVYTNAPHWLKVYSAAWDNCESYISLLNYNNPILLALLCVASFGFGINAVMASAANVVADKTFGNTAYACFRATAISFTGGVLSLWLFVLIQPTQLLICLPRLWTRRSEIRLYYLCAGLFGSGYVTLAIYLSNLEGFGAFFAGAVAGQTVSALFIDKIGFLGIVPRRPVTWLKILGLLLIIAALILFQDFSQHNSAGTEAGNIIAGLVTGALLVFQAPLNTRVSTIVDSVLIGVLLSFTIGWIVTIILFAFSPLAEPFVYNGEYASWYMYIGGPLGNFTVASGVLLPPKISMSAFYVLNISGQLTCAILLTYSDAMYAGEFYSQRWFQIIAVPIATLGAACISYENWKLDKAKKLALLQNTSQISTESKSSTIIHKNNQISNNDSETRSPPSADNNI